MSSSSDSSSSSFGSETEEEIVEFSGIVPYNENLQCFLFLYFTLLTTKYNTVLTNILHDIYTTLTCTTYNRLFLKKNKETKKEKVKLTLKHLLRINKYSLGQKDTAETK